MARGGGEWGIHKAVRGKWACSYKKTTLFVCCINIVVALYVLRSLYASLYIYSDRNSPNAVEYTPDQIRKMEESVRIRKSAEPVELIRLVKQLKKELYAELSAGVELPESLKLKLTNDIIEKFKILPHKANISDQRDFAERWCNEKLEQAKQLVLEGGTSNSTILLEEAASLSAVLLVKALESDRTQLLEDIGLWIPSEIVNNEHDDKPEGELGDELDEILPGRPLPPECHAELHTDYDGAAVRWGLNHHKESAADCCQACLVQAKRAKPNEKKCNVWVYCPAENGCHSPDIYEHRLGECWLKFAETPKLNFKDRYPESYRNSHPSAPVMVPWASGFVGAA
ncbi:uncharacterized protein LOC126783314 isoform X1 [Argentina anserina]|uniref:uncharacterized protein LOC126783314 isoform X1 n=1 Tax=Argentina anserina TaxID=57926 RepID=UPI0021768DDE|nr:uncharacterized protein LOC126783314 isoform X1 [Potentilla anserina]